jgi:hypothetical protein
VVIYGIGLDSSQLVHNETADGKSSRELSGTTVSFNGVPAPVSVTVGVIPAAV